MRLAETSLQAFRSLHSEGKIAPQESRVLAAIQARGAMTREEIAEATGLRLSAVCGRVASLIDALHLTERGTRLNPTTRKHNKLVCLTPSQLSLLED